MTVFGGVVCVATGVGGKARQKPQATKAPDDESHYPKYFSLSYKNIDGKILTWFRNTNQYLTRTTRLKLESHRDRSELLICNNVAEKFLPHSERLNNYKKNSYAWAALSQLRICRTPSLSFDPTFMKDAQCAETNEKTIFRLLRFIFLKLSWKFIENWQFLEQKWP